MFQLVPILVVDTVDEVFAQGVHIVFDRNSGSRSCRGFLTLGWCFSGRNVYEQILERLGEFRIPTRSLLNEFDKLYEFVACHSTYVYILSNGRIERRRIDAKKARIYRKTVKKRELFQLLSVVQGTAVSARRSVTHCMCVQCTRNEHH